MRVTSRAEETAERMAQNTAEEIEWVSNNTKKFTGWVIKLALVSAGMTAVATGIRLALDLELAIVAFYGFALAFAYTEIKYEPIDLGMVELEESDVEATDREIVHPELTYDRSQ